MPIWKNIQNILSEKQSRTVCLICYQQHTHTHTDTIFLTDTCKKPAIVTASREAKTLLFNHIVFCTLCILYYMHISPHQKNTHARTYVCTYVHTYICTYMKCYGKEETVLSRSG